MLYYSSKDRGLAKQVVQDMDVLTIGITPSGNGRLHLGHHITMFSMLQALSSTKSSIATVYIDDREFSIQSVPTIPNEGIVGSTTTEVSTLVQDAANYLGDSGLGERVNILRMSELFKMAGLDGSLIGKNIFDLILEHGDMIGGVFMGMRLGKTNTMTTVCPSCKTAPPFTRRVKKEVNDGIVSAICPNESCEVEKYSVDIAQGSSDWLLFYCICCLRDVINATLEGKSVIRFFGGDYGMPWGLKPSKWDKGAGVSKAARISAMMAGIGSEANQCHQIVGPLLQLGSRKLSKSKGDRSHAFDGDLLTQLLDLRQPQIDLKSVKIGD